MSPVGKPVSITLQVKSNGKWKLTIDPMDCWIRRAGEEVVWNATGADVVVEFNKNGCPFMQNTFNVPTGGNQHSNANQSPVQRKYRYSMTITPNPAIPLGTYGNMAAITIDPEVVVDDNGPPHHSARRGAKKRAAKKGPKRGSSRRAASKRR